MKIIEKIKENPILATLILIMIIGFFIRLDIYDINVNQSYWWDEADYLNTAKSWAGEGPHRDASSLRPPLFMFLISIFFYFGLSETTMRFFLILLPSTLLILVTYFLGKEIFNKKVGLIVAAITATAWNLLFNTTRVHLDVIATIFLLSSIIFFYKGYVKGEATRKNLIITGILFGIAYSTKETVLTFLPAFFIYILIKEKSNIFRNKNILYLILACLIVITPYMLYGLVQFDTPAPWFSTRFTSATQEYVDIPITMSCVNILKTSLNNLWFLILTIGFIASLKFVLQIEKTLKEPTKDKFRSEFFTILFFLTPFLIYTFVNRQCAEPRWIMPITIMGILIIGYILDKIYSRIKLKNKTLAVIIILAILAFGANEHIQQNKQIIEIKKDSFHELVEAGEFIRLTTPKDSTILAFRSHQELQYSCQREVLSPEGKTPEELLNNLKKTKPPYIVLSFYTPITENHQWMIKFMIENQQIFKPIKTYGPLINNQIPIVTIFEVDYSKF